MHEVGNIVSDIEKRIGIMAVGGRTYYDGMMGLQTQQSRSKPKVKSAKRFKAMAQRLRQAQQDIKVLQPTYEGVYGQSNAATEISRYVEMIELTFKPGRRINFHFLFAVFIVIHFASELYKKKQIPVDWDQIGLALIKVFKGVVLDDDGSRDPGEWARKIYARYKNTLFSKQLADKALRDTIARKLRDNNQHESIIIPRDYFEKLYGFSPRKSTLLPGVFDEQPKKERAT